MRCILLLDKDKETYLHGLFLIPNDRTIDQALNEVDQARQQAMEDNPEEWNYDDVHSILASWGYSEVDYTESWE